MRSILEKALIAALNKDGAQADALFHDFILERSRQIHESLRQGEDFVLDESWEQELAMDEMFSEADLEDVMPDVDYDPRIDTGVWMKTPHGSFCVVDSDEEAEKLVQRGWVETDEEEAKNESSIFDYEGLMIYNTAEEALASEGLAESEETGEFDVVSDEPVIDADATDGEEETVEDRVEDVESQLAALSAEFDALRDELGMGDEGVEGDEVVQEATIEVTDGDTSVVIDTEESKEAPVDFAAPVDDEFDGEFGSLSESILAELTSIDVDTKDGEMLGGEKVKLNTDSPIPSNDPEDRQAGEPIEVKAEEHKGFDLEKAPKVIVGL